MSAFSCFNDEIIENLNDEEVKEYFKSLVKSVHKYGNNFLYDQTRGPRTELSLGQSDPPIIPKGAGCYKKDRKEFDFANKAKRGVGLSISEESELGAICSLGIVHLCYLEETLVNGPIEKLEIEGRCQYCTHSHYYLRYFHNLDNRVFKMFITELPEIYENLKRECSKRLRQEAMLHND